LTYDPTPDTPLIREYPLCINFESVVASTQSEICQRQNFEVHVRLIRLEPSLISEFILDLYVKDTTTMP
jgi:hypothetical protein